MLEIYSGMPLTFSQRRILHFCLFVTACKDVHRQRKEIKDMKATLRAYVEMT